MLMAASCLLGAPVARAADAPAGSQLRLEDAVSLALTGNERAKISDLQVAVAEAAVEKAFTAFLPVVQAVGSDQQHAYDATPKNPNNIGQSSLTINQPIVNVPAFPLLAQAKNLASAQRAQNVDDKRLLAFAAATAFFSVLNADDVLQAANRQLDNAKANMADTQARAEAGLTSSNDVTRAHVDMASAEREVEIDKGSLDNAYVQLELVINARVSDRPVPPEATLHAALQRPGPADALLRFALDRRPDVLAARYSASAAHDFADEPLLRLLPTLGAQGQATATTNSAATGRWNDESVTATLTWTLFDSGVRYADKHSRDAQASIAEWNLRLLVRTVDAQIRAALALLASAQSAFQVADEAVKAARQSVDETAILYKQGLAKAIELIDANDQRFTAEVGYATAEFNVAQAFLNLRQALGLEALGTELK